MSLPKGLFDKNKQWADSINKKHPDFFAQLAKQQKPDYLWIGCADSRVPANELFGMLPGEIFVHRNIANMVVHTDLNCLSVLHYAVEVLKVKHIIVCGHYGCGGVKAALDNAEFGLIDNWLRHIKDVIRFHQDKIDNCSNEQEKLDLLCEFNVIEQVANLSNTSIVKNAWANGQQLAIHGLIYDIKDGVVKDLAVTLENKS
jgi:carbonic anhydrase